MVLGFAILLLIAGGLVFLAVMYNSLVGLRVRADSAWSDIDVQLKRRHDLIPNLVETVKGYAGHEKSTFENVTKYRSMAMQATGTAERAQAEGQLTMALKSLFAVAEAYPDLKASQNFLRLQEELSGTEGRIAFARQFYNDQVLHYDNSLESFPTNVVAGLFHFEPRAYFETEAEARATPRVDFAAR